MKKKNLNLLALFIPLLALACSQNETEEAEEVVENEFVSIFDGETLDGWAGDSVYWSVEDGAIVGTITEETIVKNNTFLIWQDGQPADFEIKGEFNITETGNSGVNYRSEMYTEVPNALKGYQADIDGRNRYTGQNYEERGRTTLAYIGQVTTILPQEEGWSKDSLRSKVANNAWTDLTVDDSLGVKEEMVANINEGWNEFHIVANGNRLQHYINGTLMSDVTDNDPINGKSEGYIGVQVHVGPPMKVMYRGLMLKEL